MFHHCFYVNCSISCIFLVTILEPNFVFKLKLKWVIIYHHETYSIYSDIW